MSYSLIGALSPRKSFLSWCGSVSCFLSSFSRYASFLYSQFRSGFFFGSGLAGVEPPTDFTYFPAAIFELIFASAICCLVLWTCMLIAAAVTNGANAPEEEPAILLPKLFNPAIKGF